MSRMSRSAPHSQRRLLAVRSTMGGPGSSCRSNRPKKTRQGPQSVGKPESFGARAKPPVQFERLESERSQLQEGQLPAKALLALGFPSYAIEVTHCQVEKHLTRRTVDGHKAIRYANEFESSGLPPFLVHSILFFSMELQDRVALITGSGRGIGRAIAQLFAKEGAAVFLTARTEKELGSAAAAITSAGGRAGYVPGDLSRETDCAQVVAAAQAKFGTIDILVNNAGHYGPVVPVEEYPLAGFDRVVAVHLRATFLLSKIVLPERDR